MSRAALLTRDFRCCLHQLSCYIALSPNKEINTGQHGTQTLQNVESAYLACQTKRQIASCSLMNCPANPIQHMLPRSQLKLAWACVAALYCESGRSSKISQCSSGTETRTHATSAGRSRQDMLHLGLE